MSTGTRFDVIVIGSGAGGGTLVHRLAPSGKRILLLERGEFVPREKGNWDPGAFNVEGRYTTREVWGDVHGQPLHPHTHYWVGGNTEFCGAALFRLRREDFGELKHWGGGISPAWPIADEDLEPYYGEAERLDHVHGARGEDPTEPPARTPYPHPASTADIVVVSTGAINSAALLLRSANDRHPRGLANGSDVVGRHYMGHVNSVLMAISKCPNPTVFQKTLGVNNCYFGSEEWPFAIGHISFVGKLDAHSLRAGAPPRSRRGGRST